MNKHQEIHFVSFLRENKNRFYLLAYSYVKNEQDALDIVQESIQKAFKSYHRLKNEDQIKSWFYKIIVRTSIDFLRKNQRISYVEVQTLEYLAPSLEDSYEDLDVHHALDQLPTIYREVVFLRFFEDMKLEEIAQIVQIPLSTVKSRLYHALKLLNIYLTKEDEKLG